ncbi:hypothetical protein A1O3_01079 [Capronia epimyces CBS 606.96]|uniref:rRNA-processing protein EFG1 n=1 Tax=Capronia epimyces CBS 606.96 TaxID=1182542 RepID=W9YI12_9EURO|nr:uncharacterized protein A1O3_01079 [Capronia epimyces CBS 606.96]EXJ92527.1 hypothetical protein A1O3_01079 [Capronia epimyces CBS 606.96]
MARYRPAPQTTPRDNAQSNQRNDSWRPEHGRYRTDRGNIPSHARRSRGLSPVRSAVTKTKHERETNPSTRIHSLRNLLGRESLPMTVRQEKERELAALLLDQQKAQLAKASKKNLQRYHFVRFVERQKAERTLKQLIKLKESSNCASDEEHMKKLDKSIHEAEVDLNYTKYAPLGEKYISLFVMEENDKQKRKSQMKKKSYAILTDTQREELQQIEDDLANVVRTAIGTKPPMWYEVEKCMNEGQEKLDALREGRLTVGNKLVKELAAVGGKDDAALRSSTAQPVESRPSWLDDDGVIDPADLDSDDDEDMSDGGFFER